MKKRSGFRRWAMFNLWILAACLILAVSTSGYAQETIEQIRQAIKEKGADWTAGENWVTRLGPEGLRKLCGYRPDPAPLAKGKLIVLPKLALPDRLDWRNNNGNFVTSVRNQGACGSCWDFAATAQVEAWWKIRENNLTIDLDLSEQFILSCSEGTCDGASITTALNYMDSVGIPLESCFPYRASDTVPCSDACANWKNQSLNIPGWGYVTRTDASVENLKQALMRQPIATGFTVYQDFSSYTGGVYEHTWGDAVAGHAILIVGWDDAEECWICKNSWGPNWGMNGYFKIRWGDSGIGGDATIVWDNLIPGPAITLAQSEYSLSLDEGESTDLYISLSNSSAIPVEYAAIDYEVPIAWHPDEFNAYDESSWWCGNPEIGGYDDHWLQYLDTPILDLSSTVSPKLTGRVYWAIEDPTSAKVPWDGWDGANVWISTDGGSTFGVIDPESPEYTCQSLWSFGNPDEGWNFGTGIAGWAGLSSGWEPFEFDLTGYRTDQVILRFAFASDMAYCTRDEAGVTGYFVDEIRVADGAVTLFEDDGEDMAAMDRKGFGTAAAPWMTLSNSVAEIPPSGSADIGLEVDASSLSEGNYEGIIQIDTNDSTLAGIIIPIHLQVNQDTGIDENQTKIPGQFALYQNFPNPFNGSTVIPYVLSEDSRVTISVIDPLGRVVSVLYAGYQESGYYQATWNGKDRSGMDAVSGLYFLRLQAGNRTLSKKCLLIR